MVSADTQVLEIESKFDVPLDAGLPDLSSLSHGSAAGARRRVDLEAVYFDTADLDLMALGMTLRRRRGGDDAGWHLKLPGDGGRHELRVPLTNDDLVPQHFQQVLRGTTHGAPLGKVGTITTCRTVIPVTDVTGHLVAELCDDRVTAVRWKHGESSRLEWREWELELVGDRHAGDAEQVARDVAARLRDAGASPSRYASKLARVLEAPPSALDADAIEAGETARDVLAPYLAAQVRRMRQLDPLVRADLPDALHQMRVACRRVRAVLTCFRREFDRGAMHHVRKELGWLVDVLGRERDLEVLCDHVGALVTRHQPEVAACEAWVGDSLARDLDAARGAARAGLCSDRYDALVRALTDQSAWPPWADRSNLASGRELRRGLRAEWARLQVAATAARHTRGSRRDEALHEVRKSAKRLRYAAEAVRPRFGDRAGRLAEAMAEVQDVLGRHHDEAVAREAVVRLDRESSDEARRGGVGRILEELADEQAADAGAYARTWKQLTRDSAATRWLR